MHARSMYGERLDQRVKMGEQDSSIDLCLIGGYIDGSSAASRREQVRSDEGGSMTFLEIVEIIVVTLIVYFGLSQIFIPWAKGTLFFPMFRKTGEMAARLKHAKQDLEDTRLKAAADKIEKKAKEEKEKWKR